MSRRINFERYEDGFGRDVPIRDLVSGDDLTEKELARESGLIRYQHPVMMVNHAMIPLCDATSYGKRYNAYLGHTNFDLSPNEVDRIQAVPGVEVIDIFSRYRFRLCVGKAFEATEVLSNIRDVAKTEIHVAEEFPEIRVVVGQGYDKKENTM